MRPLDTRVYVLCKSQRIAQLILRDYLALEVVHSLIYINDSGSLRGRFIESQIIWLDTGHGTEMERAIIYQYFNRFHNMVRMYIQ